MNTNISFNFRDDVHIHQKPPSIRAENNANAVALHRALSIKKKQQQQQRTKKKRRLKKDTRTELRQRTSASTCAALLGYYKKNGGCKRSTRARQCRWRRWCQAALPSRRTAHRTTTASPYRRLLHRSPPRSRSRPSSRSTSTAARSPRRTWTWRTLAVAAGRRRCSRASSKRRTVSSPRAASTRRAIHTRRPTRSRYSSSSHNPIISPNRRSSHRPSIRSFPRPRTCPRLARLVWRITRSLVAGSRRRAIRSMGRRWVPW